MKEVAKWAERIYAETDVGRSAATSVAGLIGLIVYLSVEDWVIAALSLVIVFPLARLGSTWLHGRASRSASRRLEREAAELMYDGLSDAEKQVVRAFVEVGGTVLTWSHVNSLGLPDSGIESLLQRGILHTSVTADGMRETFALEPATFDVARARQGRRPAS